MRAAKTTWNKTAKKSRITKPKKTTLSKLDKELDVWYSRFIRLRDAPDKMDAVCYTCGRVLPIKSMQNGHYISRAFKSTKYHEWNTHAQCVRCNVTLKGNSANYALHLIEDYGDGILQNLAEASKKPFKGSVELYNEMIDNYKKLVKKLDVYGIFD